MALCRTSDGADGLLQLAELLREPEDEDKLGPAQCTVVPRVGPICKDDDDDSNKVQDVTDRKAIWLESEVPREEELPFLHDASDTRRKPEFTMVFAQAVGTEDVFFRDEKTPLHSDSLVYKIAFPDHTQSQLDVDATRTTLTAESARLKLAVYLPRAVDAHNAKAKWDPKKSTLNVTLPVLDDFADLAEEQEDDDRKVEEKAAS